MKALQADKIKVTGDVPSPRFGHTLTMVSASKAVLFGGAVSAQSTADITVDRFVITNETYLFDFVTSVWSKLAFRQEFVPSERAAHAAVMVSDMQMIIYGGAASGNQGLLKDELYLLDVRKEYPLF
jgi:protein phosphatase